MNETYSFSCINCIMEKKKVSSPYLKENKDKLYSFAAGRLADAIKLDCDNVEIRIDKSKRKSLLRKDFNEYLSQKLKNGSNFNEPVIITHSY